MCLFMCALPTLCPVSLSLPSTLPLILSLSRTRAHSRQNRRQVHLRFVSAASSFLRPSPSSSIVLPLFFSSPFRFLFHSFVFFFFSSEREYLSFYSPAGSGRFLFPIREEISFLQEGQIAGARFTRENDLSARTPSDSVSGFTNYKRLGT